MVKNPEISNQLRHMRINVPISVYRHMLSRSIQECILRSRECSVQRVYRLIMADMVLILSQ
jgi:hypothetical protein